MQKLVLLFISLLFLCGLGAQGKVVVQIHNIRNDKGVCRVCLFNSAASFSGEKGKPYNCMSVPVSNKRAGAVFTNVASGAYALFVFHDANNNNKFDTNFLGIPKEGYGASKNNLPFAAAPGFKENMFRIDDGSTVTLQVKLRNL